MINDIIDRLVITPGPAGNLHGHELSWARIILQSGVVDIILGHDGAAIIGIVLDDQLIQLEVSREVASTVTRRSDLVVTTSGLGSD